MVNKLSQEEIDVAIDTYFEVGGNYAETSRRTNISVVTLRKYLRDDFGLPSGRKIPVEREPRQGIYRGFKSAREYYQAHKELHSLGRTELARSDTGLYKTLLREGVMEKIIPIKDGGRPRSVNIPRNLYNLFMKHNENASDLAREIGVSRSTLDVYLREKGLKPNGKKGPKGPRNKNQ